MKIEPATNDALRTHTADLVDRCLEHFPEEAKRLSRLRHQIDTCQEIFHRKTLPGHVTASGIVIRGQRMLMIRHPFLGRWLQPGGHVEPGEAPEQAGTREVLEETGMHCTLHEWHGANCIPIDIDIHVIPANPRKNAPQHLHYDFRYVLNFCTASEQGGDDMHEWEWRLIRDIAEPHLQCLVKKLAHQHLIPCL